MEVLIKPDWDIFKAKFSENKQENFEWLCYLLFCKEYGQEKGIFSYKNQAAIETNPILVGDELIGFQAKFYDTTLSEHKTDLINTLESAKSKYKGINKLIVYTNQKWGQGKNGNDTKPKKEIEDKAKELEINLVWYTASFFGSIFVAKDNKEIAQHFFTTSESIIDRLNKIIPRIERLNKSYENNFRPIIGTFINRPEIDQCIELIKQNNSFIIHGKAGQGKSGCTHGIIEYCKTENIPYIAIKLDDRMPDKNVDKWGEELGLTTSIPNALKMICEDKRGIIILDQLDALRWTNTHSRQALNTCTELIKEVEKINYDRDNKINIIFVCRTYDYENDNDIKSLFTINNIKEETDIVWKEILVGDLSEEVVRRIVGIRYNHLSNKMKQVLSIASNLYIWVRLKEESKYDDYSTTNELIQEWWRQLKKNCRRNSVNEEDINNTVSQLINKINCSGKLHINHKLLDITEKSFTYLISNGFIVENGKKVSFAHQSILDYFLAKEMFNRYSNGENIISVIGDKDKQTPQKRYQVQMLLQDIQLDDEEEFINVGIQMMESNEIRFYVKYVFFEVLGQSVDIGETTSNFILDYCEDDKYGEHIIDTVVLGHPYFLDILLENGILDKWITLDGKVCVVIKLLQSLSPKDMDKYVDFIERYIFQSNDYTEKFSRLFGYRVYDDTDTIFELRLRLYNKYPKFLDSIYFEELLIRNIIRAVRVLQLALKNEMSCLKIYKDEYKILSNDISIQDVDFILDTLSKYIPEQRGIELSKWNARYYSKTIERVCVQVIKKANTTLVKTNPKEFINRYREYFNKGFDVYNEIILDGLKQFSIELSDLVINCLYDNFNNIIFDKSSSTKNKLDMVKDVIEIHSRYCDYKTYLKIEEKIIKYIDPRAKEWYERRIEHNRDKNNDKKVYWSFWGDLQMILIPSLDNDRVSLKAKRLLDVLKRRNISYVESNIYDKNSMQSGGINSPISGKKLGNKQWKQILNNNKLEDRDRRLRLRKIKESYVESSIESFAEQLNYAASKEPGRFINLILDNGCKVNDIYIDSLFSGIACSQNLQEVNNKLLEKLILTYKYDYEGYRARYICDIIRNKSNGEWSYKILDILKDIALNHIDPKIYEQNRILSDDKESKSFERLQTKSFNCTRGAAARAIGKLLWDNKRLFEYFYDTIIQLCQDENPAVRLATLDILSPIYHINRELATEKTIEMLKSDYRIAGHKDMKQIFFVIYNDNKEVVENIILKCFNQKDKDLIIRGAYTLAQMYIWENRFTDIVEDITLLNQEQVNYILEMVILYFDKEEYNELAKTLILNYMKSGIDLEFPINRIFYDNLIDINRDEEFLKSILSFKTSKKIVHAFVHYLEKSNESILAYKEIILSISYSIINNTNESEDYIYGVDEVLSKLIIGLYDEVSVGNTKEMKEICTECLEIWDLMFENRIEAARILSSKMIDR